MPRMDTGDAFDRILQRWLDTSADTMPEQHSQGRGPGRYKGNRDDDNIIRNDSMVRKRDVSVRT